MDTVSGLIQMEILILASGLKTWLMAMEFMNGQTAIDTRVNGSIH